MRTDALLVILVAVSQVAAEYRQAAAETPAGRAVEEYAGSSVSPEDVLKAAKAGWRRVRERYHYFSATVSWHLVLDNVLDGLVDSQTISREGVIKKYDDRVWLAVGQHQERKRTGKTATLARGACVNDRYVFAVEGQSLRGPYRLVEQRRATQDVVAEKRQVNPMIPPELQLDMKYTVGVDEVLVDDATSIISARRLTGQGGALVVLKVTRTPTAAQVRQNIVQRRYLPQGTFELVLDPNCDYRVVRFQDDETVPAPDGKNMLTVKSKVTRRYEQPSERQLIAVTEKTLHDKSGEIIWYSIEQENFTFERPKREEFYLTAFGLPEPPDYQAKRTGSVYWWLMAVGFTFVVIGFVLWGWSEGWHQKNNR